MSIEQTDSAIIQLNPFLNQLTLVETPKQSEEMEALAKAAMAFAMESESYEMYTNAWYAYIMARRKTTELLLPHAPKWGGNRGKNQYAEWQDDTDVILPTVEFNFNAKQWQRRLQELEADIDAYFNECVANGWQPTLAGLYEMVKQKSIKAKRAEIAKRGEEIKQSKGKLWEVFHGDIRTWTPPQQYDFIITDPPYPKEFLPLWEVLAEKATTWLKPGGLLVAMSGHFFLPEIYAMMSKHLDYFWTGAYWTPGESASNWQNHINQQWKPLLMWQRRDAHHKGRAFSDVFKSDANDKNLHKWGQSESGMYDIVSKICNPGQTILDPFLGAGTTLIAAVRYGCPAHGLEIDIENVNISKARLAENDKAT